MVIGLVEASSRRLRTQIGSRKLYYSVQILTMDLDSKQDTFITV
jgi:hypothetical protein